ncbi:MAG: DUF4302 domain-containing protein [Bacteroidales bacterium]|nr:DUF4302 domain-containing protein [Bacteroidales bacterium]
MKNNRITSALIIAAALVSSQSCLKNQKDIFEESSSQRLENYLSDLKSTLTGAKNGWVMEYYPGAEQAYGGYCYVLYFTNTEVEAFSEIDIENSYRSAYKLTTDYGPVLSFDVHNPLLHYFATPSSGMYEALGGDFEFMIKSISSEKIEMLGKRSQNIYTLRPMASDAQPLEYVTKVAEMSENMRAAEFEGTIGDQEVKGEVDMNYRALIFNLNDTTQVYAPFMYTPEGLRTYEPVKIGGCTFQDLYYLTENNIFTNGVFTLKGKLPEDYTPYGEFAGDYTFYYYTNNSRSLNVTLSPDEAGTGYVLSGLNSNYTVRLEYDRAKGRLVWRSQIVGANGNNPVILAAWDLNHGGSLTWSSDAGCYIKKNLETGYFDFEDLGQYEGIATDSWILWEVDSDMNGIGQYYGWGNSQIAYIGYLKRK